MTDHKTFSDEMLNAYIDGELGDDDARLLLEELQADHALSERLAHLREVSDMLKMSYAGIEAPEHCEPCEGWRVSKSIAAGVLLMLGVAIGWYAHTPEPHSSVFYEQLSGSQPKDGVWRIVMHANVNDDFMQSAMLDETEKFLETFEANGQKAEVEIVAYGAGLSLLMADRTMYADRISNMQKHFGNLHFTACKRSMKRIENLEGEKITLLPNIDVAASGISQILKRQREGWHYIRL